MHLFISVVEKLNCEERANPVYNGCFSTKSYDRVLVYQRRCTTNPKGIAYQYQIIFKDIVPLTFDNLLVLAGYK